MCQTPDEFSPGPIDFPSRLKRAKPYGNGTIFYREYTTEDLPSQEELVSDLETVVEIYSDLLNRRATNINLDLDGKQVWQVSPGSNEDRWPAWEEDEVASIGWNLHPEEFDRDISEIDSLDETSIRVDEGQGFAYRFSQEIAVGDVIVAAIRGKSNPDKVYGVGRVTDTDPDVESRELHENIQDDNHFVSVDWAEFGTYVPITLGANDPLTTKTLTDIDEDDARHLFGTTLAHATAGGLYTDVAEAASALDQATELDVEVVESSEQPDSTSDEDPDDSDDTDSGDAETEGGPWTLSEIDRMEPDFGKGPDDIDLNELYFEDEGELLSEILDALRREKHLLFVGPPGTGKSKLASRVANELVGHEYEMTTATADWSTFDTIGGYRQQTDGELVFKPGLFLSRFQDGDGRPDHEWLIVDEFNRANIDKAFGSLFSVLAGDDVVLPFVDERDRDITVLGSEVKPARSIGSHEFVVPDTWRLLATMNTFDKSSLYDLSYALSRRFAYIHVPAPDYDDIDVSLVNSYVGCWKGINPSDDEIESTTELWKAVQQERPLGPAIIRDILSAADGDITAGVTQHVLPQFEGLMKRRQEDLLSRIADVDAVQSDRIGSFGRQYFELHDLALTDEAE
jgi:MoxR-like ATPase